MRELFIMRIRQMIEEKKTLTAADALSGGD